MDTDIDFKEFSYSYTCIIVFFIMFAITARKDLSIFIKINTYGVIFTVIIISFILVTGIWGFIEGGFTYVTFVDNKNGGEVPPMEIILFGTAYGPLVGILGGGYYLHNISLNIYQNSKNPDNNVRDMFIGFLIVCISYCICGVLGMHGFSSTAIFGPDNVIN